MSSQTLSSKPKEESAVVTLGVVVHESTTKLILATGVMVHLFGGGVEFREEVVAKQLLMVNPS